MILTLQQIFKKTYNKYNKYEKTKPVAFHRAYHRNMYALQSWDYSTPELFERNIEHWYKKELNIK